MFRMASYSSCLPLVCFGSPTVLAYATTSSSVSLPSSNSLPFRHRTKRNGLPASSCTETLPASWLHSAGTCHYIHTCDVCNEDIFQVGRVTTGLGVEVCTTVAESTVADYLHHCLSQLVIVNRELVGIPSVLIITPVASIDPSIPLSTATASSCSKV